MADIVIPVGVRFAQVKRDGQVVISTQQKTSNPKPAVVIDKPPVCAKGETVTAKPIDQWVISKDGTVTVAYAVKEAQDVRR
jgi:hypothetical protein